MAVNPQESAHDLGQIQHGVSKMQQAENEIRDDLGKLKGICSDIGTVHWVGPAAARFTQLMQDWDRNGSELMNALQAIHVQLDKTGKDLEFTRDVTKDMFNTELPDYRSMMKG